MTHKTFAIAITAALLAGPAVAQSGAELGILNCKVTDVSNVVLYTTQNFDCQFTPAKGEVETYAGKITKIGVDLSIKNDFELVWTVVSATSDMAHDKVLSGTYVGAGADVAIGAGMGAKVLVGGEADKISLQPVSIAGVEGVGASIGIERFELE